MPDDVIDYEDAFNLGDYILQDEILYIQSMHNSSGKIHPNQKPTALFEWLIRTYTNENNIVLDNYIGSGSTAIACINTNRNYIGFELDNTYYNLTTERIDSHKNNLS